MISTTIFYDIFTPRNLFTYVDGGGFTTTTRRNITL